MGLLIKRGVIAVILIALVVTILGCLPQTRKVVDSSLAIPNYTAEILQKFQESDYVRVTVVLKKPSADLINKSAPAEQHQQKKAYTESIVNYLLSNLDRNQFELIGVLTQGFVARIDREAYLELLESPYVEQIYPEREVKTS